MLGFGELVLLGPAADLTCAIIGRLAEIPKPDGNRILGVEIGKSVDHRVVDFFPLGRCIVGQRAVPETAPVGETHDEELRTDNFRIFAQAVCLGHGEAGGLEGMHHRVFPVHGMRTWQQLAERLAAQHIAARRRVDPVGRVGLATLELGIAQGAFETFDIGRKPL